MRRSNDILTYLFSAVYTQKKHLPTTLVSECFFVEISQGRFQRNQFETAPFRSSPNRTGERRSKQCDYNFCKPVGRLHFIRNTQVLRMLYGIRLKMPMCISAIRSHKRKFSNIFCVIDYNGYSAILNFFCQLCLQLLLQSFYFLESRIR